MINKTPIAMKRHCEVPNQKDAKQPNAFLSSLDN